MREFPSTDAKDKWGLLTDTAMQEPVTITKHGRPALIVTSVRDYEELQRLKYEKLKADVGAGFETLDRGESTRLESDADLAGFMNAVKQRGRRRLKRERE